MSVDAVWAARSMMPVQAPAAYSAEKQGNLQHLLDIFAAQRRYLESYVLAVGAFSADDTWEVDPLLRRRWLPIIFIRLF